MDYEEISDFEVNRLTARALGLGFRIRTVRGDDKKVRLGNGLVKDYCNNPSDAWQIIVENKINIEWRDSLKLHPLAKGTGGNACHWSDKNPLRAAMICFLKMKYIE